MKRSNHLYEKLISDENLRLALLEVNTTHRWLPRHRRNETVCWAEQDIPSRVKELRGIIDGLIDGTMTLGKPKKTTRWDKSACKFREINEPLLWPDQYIHHALIQVLEPVMMRGMDRYCCGSICGRGIHYGMKAIKKWMHNDPNGTKHCGEFDIHHFYDSIKSRYVIRRMKRLIKDRRVLRLIEVVTEDGILIGVYCSQWFANTLLQPLDDMIRKSGLCNHYLRYMDNFTVFGSNKRKLHKLRRLISDWLGGIGLTLKSNWQIFPTAARMPCALGYRYGHGYTLLKKRNLFRLKRHLSSYYRKKDAGKRVSPHMAAGLLSRLGQLSHCNHYDILRRIYRKKTQRELEDIVREYNRKERTRWNTFLEETACAA